MGEEESGRKHLGPLLAIGAIATACGIGLGLLIDWFPTAASEEAGPIDTLWDVLVMVSVPIFVLTQTIVLYSVWRFRMRPGEELKDGPPIHGNTRLEVVWTAVPAIILVALCSYAYVVLRDIETADASEMKVRVVGEQFTWTFFYQSDPTHPGKEIASSQLYLPEGKQVRFDVQSKDVLHDFWVPAFRQKIDAVPGITTRFRVKPVKTGTFPVVCAELCGLGHSVMRQSAHVVSQGDFDAWLDKKKQAAGGGGEEAAGGGGGGAAAPDGKTLFASGASPACGSCHTLSDAGADATIGPNLDEVLKGKDAAFIQQSIEQPGAEVAKGFQDGIMPTNYGDTLQPEEIKALTDYLVKVATK
jgi:cytochrome c oxidase subunit 2